MNPFDESTKDSRCPHDPSKSIDAPNCDRATPTLRELYDRAASTPSDIWEHVPVLYKYASTIRHITEFGTRHGNSTSAFLFARPDRLIAYDLQRPSQMDEFEIAASSNGIEFEFVQTDVRGLARIEETDLLFIDTWHVYEQMQAELRFAASVRRYIILHDTETFGIAGEGDGLVGIWPAVGEFLRQSADWELHQIFRANNGLTILKRISR